MSGDSASTKISGALKAIALAGLIAITSGLASKVWDALPPLAVSALVTLGLIFALTFPSWRLIIDHLNKKVEEARLAVVSEEDDAAEQHARDRAAVWLGVALISALVVGLLLATWVCGLLNVPTPVELLLWMFD